MLSEWNGFTDRNNVSNDIIIDKWINKGHQHPFYIFLQWSKREEFDILNYINKHANFFQLMDTVGNVNNEVVIYCFCIYGSNY